MVEHTLFQSYITHLLGLKNFLEKERKSFSEIPTPNRHNDFEKIVYEAKAKASSQIEAAIQEISKYVDTLEAEKQRQMQIARDDRPSKQSKH